MKLKDIKTKDDAQEFKENLNPLIKFDRLYNTDYCNMIYKVFKKWSDELKKEGNVHEGTSLAEDGIPPTLFVDFLALKTLEIETHKLVATILNNPKTTIISVSKDRNLSYLNGQETVIRLLKQWLDDKEEGIIAGKKLFGEKDNNDNNK